MKTASCDDLLKEAVFPARQDAEPDAVGPGIVDGCGYERLEPRYQGIFADIYKIDANEKIEVLMKLDQGTIPAGSRDAACRDP